MTKFITWWTKMTRNAYFRDQSYILFIFLLTDVILRTKLTTLRTKMTKLKIKTHTLGTKIVFYPRMNDRFLLAKDFLVVVLLSINFMWFWGCPCKKLDKICIIFLENSWIKSFLCIVHFYFVYQTCTKNIDTRNFFNSKL
mgnify:CR=1 FL=1